MKIAELACIKQGISQIKKTIKRSNPVKHTLSSFLKKEWVLNTIKLLTYLIISLGIKKFFERVGFKILSSVGRKKGVEVAFIDFNKKFKTLGREEQLWNGVGKKNPPKGTEARLTTMLKELVVDIASQYGTLAILFVLYCSLRLAERKRIAKASKTVDIFEQGIAFAYDDETRMLFDKTATIFVKKRPRVGFFSNLLAWI